jgi:hypothetical protein
MEWKKLVLTARVLEIARRQHEDKSPVAIQHNTKILYIIMIKKSPKTN